MRRHNPSYTFSIGDVTVETYPDRLAAIQVDGFTDPNVGRQRLSDAFRRHTGEPHRGRVVVRYNHPDYMISGPVMSVGLANRIVQHLSARRDETVQWKKRANPRTRVAAPRAHAVVRNPKRLAPLRDWRHAETTAGPAYFFTTTDGYRFALSPNADGSYRVAVEGAFDATQPGRVWVHPVSGEAANAAAAHRRAALYYTYNLVRPVSKSLRRERAAGDRQGTPSSFRAFAGGQEPTTGDFVQDGIAQLERERRGVDLRERLAAKRSASRSNPRLTPQQVKDRLFIGVYPSGLKYADNSREKLGDFHEIAFLPFSSLDLKWANGEERGPFRDAVLAHARGVQARRGEQYPVSATGQTVLLGYTPKTYWNPRKRATR